MAYQIGWGNLLIGWYEAGIKGEVPIYKKYQTGGIKKFRKTVIRILKIVEDEYQQGNLDKIGIWQWSMLKSGKKWPLSK